MNHEELLAYYSTPGIFTTVGPFAEQVDALPGDIGEIARAVQMLVVHRFWADAYKMTITPERELEQGLHGAEAMLTRAMKRGPAAIGQIRLPDARVVGNCRHFSTMMTAFLRHKGIPARARCGFSSYYQPGKYDDHWVCEYWNAADARWVQVDAQLDTLQVSVIKADFDPLDVPRDRFVVAGAAWQMIHDGRANADDFGIADMWGAWFVRGDLTLDVASLQKVELLPWEPFGIAKGPESTIPDTPELMALVDRLVDLTADGGDASISELLDLAATDARLRPPEATIPAALKADIEGPTVGNPVIAG